MLYVLNGVSYDKAEVVPNGVRILRGGNIQNGKIIPDNSDVFLPQTYSDYERNLQQNDIVIVASTGSKSVIGKAGFVLENMPNTQIGAFLRLLRPISPKIAEYLRLIFSSEFYRQHIRDSVSGININNIKNEYVTEFLVPLPPLSEQNRIVDKIEELEPLVDRYGNVAEELARIKTAFPEELKNSILQQAIEGKLVPQDPTDEPASVLLERIKQERQQLILNGKIKASKPPKSNEPLNPADMPFQIPDSWVWVKFGEIASITTGTKDANEGDSQGEYDFFTCALVPIKSKSYSFDGEYLILPGNGANVGKCIHYIGKFEAYQRTYVVQCYKTFMKYIYYVIMLKWEKYNQDKLFGSAIPYIKLSNLEDFSIPLPPLSEQKRIVHKVDKFIKLIDCLNQIINQAA